MKIKDICTSVTDGSHNPPQGIEKSEYMMLSSKNIFDDEITFDEPRFLSQKDFEREHKRTKIAVGDVLLTIVGTVGRTAVVDEDMPAFALQRSVAVLHPKNDVCLPRFLMYALRGKRTYIENRAKGVAQKGIYLKEVSDIDIYIPDISNQEIIINKLDKVNAIIKLRQEELLALDDLIKARFIEMFGDVQHEEKYKGIPLRDLCTTMSGGTPSTKFTEYYEGDIPWISTVSLGPNHINGSTAKGYITQEAIENSATKLIPAGNILFGTRVGVGKSSLNDVDICTNQDIVAIIGIDESRFKRLFIKYVLDAYQPYYDSIKKGATILGITGDDLKDTLIPDVPLSIQVEFELFVEQVDKSKVIKLKNES